MLNLFASDATGATTAAAIFAAVACVLVVGILCFASDEVHEPPTTVAHSRFAMLNDLRAFAISTGIAATPANLSRLALHDAPLLGVFRDPANPHALPLDLRYSGEKHITVFGAPGSSKSTSLAAVNLLVLRRSFLVLDMKGQLFSICGAAREAMGRVIKVNAFGVLGIASDGWNALLQLDPKSRKFYANARAIAQAVIDQSGDGKSQFFEVSALNLWTAFCMLEVIQNPTRPHMRNVRERIVAGGNEFRAALVAMTEADHYGLRVMGKAMLARLDDKSSQNTSLQDVVFTVLGETDFLNDDGLAADMEAGGAIDFASMHDDLTTVFFIVPMSEIDGQRKYLRMFINLAISSFFDKAPRKGALPNPIFLLDEVGNIGRMPQVLRALTAIRDYHVTLFFLLQELAQIQTAYKDEWTQFFSGSGAKIWLTVGAGDTTTAEHAAKTCGKCEVEMVSNNISGGTSGPQGRAGMGATLSTQVFDLIPQEDFTRLAQGDFIARIEPCPHTIRGRALAYHKLFDPSQVGVNPYYHG